jgi:ribosomal protein L11 methylase PrmA
MSRLLVPGGCFIGSGISFERWAEVEKALDSAGLSLAEVLRTPRLRPRDDEGWIGFAAYFSSA